MNNDLKTSFSPHSTNITTSVAQSFEYKPSTLCAHCVNLGVLGVKNLFEKKEARSQK
jgi:hypothetical protein